MRGRVVSKSHTKAQRLEIWENGFKTTKVIEPSYNVIVEYKGNTMTYMTWTEMLKVLIYLVIRKKFSNFAIG